MNKEMIMVSYFFSEKDGVGSLRSRSLDEFLRQHGYNTFIISRDSFKVNNFFYWVFKACLYIKRSPVKKVYVTCGPYQHIAFISLVCYLFKKELIVDFRDPWSLNIKTSYGKNSGNINYIKLFISEKIEILTYKLCSKFVVCTKGMYDEYSRLFRDNKNLCLIMNGHNLDIGISYKEDNIFGKTDSNINYVCLGKFAEYSSSKALKILKEIKSNINMGISFHIHFVGTNNEVNFSLVKELELEKYCTFYPRMSYLEALEIARNCDIGLIVIRDEKIDCGTKVFDYLGLGLPIFDAFQKGSNFTKQFSSYFTKLDKFEIPYDVRLNYSRKSQFKKFLDFL